MQNCITIAVSLFCAVACSVWSPALAENSDDVRVSFVRSVAPVLVAKCQACHGVKAAESNYRLDSFAAFMQAGDFGSPPVTAGELESSEIYRLITAEDPEERMPNNGARLTEAEIKTISDWIVQGAVFDGQDPAAPLRTQVPADIPHPAPPAMYPHPIPVTAMAFTADGSQLVVGGYHELLVWETKTGSLAARVQNIPQRVLGVAFTPDGSRLTIAGGAPGVSGEVRAIPWSEEQKKANTPIVLATHDDVFLAVACRNDGAQLAAAGADGTVRIFDLAANRETLKLNSHADWVTAIAYSPDGTRLATASRDKTAKVFDASTGNLVATFSEQGVPLRAVAFAPDGKSVLTGGGRRLCVWNAEDGKLIGEMTSFTGDIHSIVVQNESVFAASSDRSVRQFKLADRSLVRTLADHTAPVIAIASDASTQLLSAGCFDGKVSITNLQDGKTLTQFVSQPAATAK